MRAPTRPRLHERSRSSSRAGFLFLTLLSLAPVLAAQEVPYTSPGIISITGVPMIYNDKWAIQKSDFGFLWLDTSTLQPGIVQVEAKCGLGQPPPVTGVYVLGDCNGITNVSSSGNTVLARQYSGQCAAAVQGCGGVRVDGTGMFSFRLGTWEYLGQTSDDIPDSTQTTDLAGRTWVVLALDTTGRHFLWKAGVNPSAPPTANATATNLSAAGRVDKTNYYGDKWQLQDASISGSAITRIDWDFLYTGAFSPNESGDPASESSVIGYFPCDPSGVVSGSFRTGASCLQSLGLTNPPPANSFGFAMQSANANGTSTTPFFSSAVPVTCPQASLVGFTNFSGTCAKTGGTLNVLAGGSADASASAGNVSEAAFDWAFTGSSSINVQGQVVPIPTGATGFALTITYPGGYRATAQGSIVQTSLIAAFSASPNPVLIQTSLTLVNQMRISGATLNAVDYKIESGACGVPPTIASSPVGGNFLVAGGTATVPSPSTAANYCVYLKYTYTPQGQLQKTQVVSGPLTAVTWSASPQISISPVPYCTTSCQFQAGTTYQLWDSESISVLPHPSSQWDLDGVSIGSSADANAPISWIPTNGCSSCTLRLTVNGSNATLPVTISGAAPSPTPTPTPTSTSTPNLTPTATPTTAPPPSPTGFYTVEPCRLADTRDPEGVSGGPALAANTVRSFPVANLCSIPASAKAVAMNITVVSPTGNGDLRAFASGQPVPYASAINYRGGIVRANNAIVSISSGGLSLQCDMVTGSTDVVIDVFGYFQ
jgi:hypothetical protein